MLRIAIRAHGQAERIFETDEDQVTIGRAGHNSLVIDNPHISSQHARIELLAMGTRLKDVGSTNGSMIERQGRKIAVEAGGQAVSLEVSDHIILGDSEAPVTLVLLESTRDRARGGLSAPPPTAISEVPVDPSAGGAVKVRLPASQFGELSDDLISRPAYARALHGLLPLLVDPDLASVAAAVAEAMFSFSDAASHFYFCVDDVASGAPSVEFRFSRAAEAKVSSWQPRRAVLTRAANAREAWHLSDLTIKGLTQAQEGETLCAPLFVDERAWGYLLADNRESQKPFALIDLKMMASLSYVLSTAIPAFEVTAGDSRSGGPS